MRLHIADSDRMFTKKISFYLLAHLTAFFLYQEFMAMYYPETTRINIVLWIVGLSTARLYKILMKGIYGGFSCLAPLLFFPISIPFIYRWFGVQTSGALLLLDYASIGVPIYMIFIRLANILNSELIGIPTESLWAISYQRHHHPRIPVQLYEVGMGMVLLFYHMLHPPSLGLYFAGQNYLISFFVLGVTRFALEFYKDNETNYSMTRGKLNQEQIVVLLLMSVTILNFIIYSYIE